MTEAKEYSTTTPAYTGKDLTHANLILEGGAMRGQFTAGVLDYFMEQGLFCDNTIGVSAGSLCGYNYVAGQIGRSCYQNLKYCDDWRYLSMKSFVRTGNAFGRDFAFREIPEELDPFDYATFNDSPMNLTVVSSNLETGEADYHLMKSQDDLPYMIASSSMPLVSQIVEVDNKLLLDGGTCDSVPILYSLLSGVKKHIVVLTQDATYEKKPNKMMPAIRQLYSDYPHYLDRLQYRHYEYNRTYRFIKQLEKEGVCFVIRPPEPVTISSMEKDREKLLELYEQGYAEAMRNFKALENYLTS